MVARFWSTGSVDCKCNIGVNVTGDDPSSGGATYKGFQTFANGNFKGRGLNLDPHLHQMVLPKQYK